MKGAGAPTEPVCANTAEEDLVEAWWNLLQSRERNGFGSVGWEVECAAVFLDRKP